MATLALPKKQNQEMYLNPWDAAFYHERGGGYIFIKDVMGKKTEALGSLFKFHKVGRDFQLNYVILCDDEEVGHDC